MNGNPRIEISLDDQTLHVIAGETVVKTFRISSSAKGMGFIEGSYRTPIGNFEICEKIGADSPIGTIFKARKPDGIWNPENRCDEDLVLTRILRLAGNDLENQNTFSRFIYIHGTNQEDKIGQPASHGCIRLNNEDIIELFDMIPDHTKVLIHPMQQTKGKLLFLDCDSTLSAIEGIDELARLSDPAIFEEVVNLTNAAMNGDVPLDQVFKKRMEIIRPSFDMVRSVSQCYLDHIVPGAEKLIQHANAHGWTTVILSGGFEPIIRPLAKHFGIDHVEAVPLYFDESGKYLGYGEDYPTTRNLGKNEIIRQWKAAMLPEKVIMIGDGTSDLETKPDVNLIIGFGGVVSRDRVKEGAHAWITQLDDSLLFDHLSSDMNGM
ncbi:MAG: HAD-IB family phosphatase [Akkermansiaceae bacterium]|jgi:phosphoserine phosphatase